ncbi:hypothetical protein LVJ94_08270 [Pendulispora rubella]|uniref:Carboxypeptidase regulatory-like domain-containing protein n=1 Tax=Pendulispora rubella TaxID=2741070 RepID=A0ABZ2LCE0_9BACT
MRVSAAPVVAAVATAALSTFAVGCEEPQVPTFDVVIHVESDPGVPLPGAVLSRENKDVGTTDATGRAKLTVRGNEGSAFDYFVRCPQDYESPPKPITVVLRRVVDKNKPPEYPVSCPPSIRKLVIAVRADGGPNLPITYLQQRVATTDASGSATILLNMRPGDQFELGLDTSMKGYERLRPQNPIFAFQVKPRDEVLALNAKFSLEKGKIRTGPVRQGPVFIGKKSED